MHKEGKKGKQEVRQEEPVRQQGAGLLTEEELKKIRSILSALYQEKQMCKEEKEGRQEEAAQQAFEKLPDEELNQITGGAPHFSKAVLLR